MVVWQENHAFHSGGLVHSVKKLTFLRLLSIFWKCTWSFFLGGGREGGAKRGERSCHPLVSNIHNYESYSIGSKSQRFDAAVTADILDCYYVRELTDYDEIKLFRYFAFYKQQILFCICMINSTKI